MRSFHKSLVYGIAIVIILSGSGCKKFVSISPPQTEVVTASVFTSDANATSAMTGIYTGMENSSDLLELSLNLGLLADEITNYSSNSLSIEYYTNSMQSKDISQPWNDGYNYVYQANAVISGLQAYGGVTADAKRQLTGEAEFIRAFWYFYLTNCYGDLPLVTSTDYTLSAAAVQAPPAQIYQQIVADLTNAESILSTNFVDVTDSVSTLERVRPTKWAAAALLARAYLYTGKYDSAEAQSTLVIDNANNLFILCKSLDSVFLKNNTEAIWQIPPVQPSSNVATPEGQDFILTTSPVVTGIFNGATISPQLINSFETGDMRAAHWIGVYESGSDSFYFPYKYKQYQTSTLSEYSTILRLAEQYLIRAEARAEQGNTGGAIADLNIIRNRAGLSSYTGATDKTSLLTAIWHERQVELFTELGDRWLNLNRTSTINSVMNVVTPTKGGSWSTDWELFPVPLTDLTNDPKLVQNNGY